MPVKPAKVARKTALPMEELMTMYIKSMKLTSGLNTKRVFSAWDEASGAAEFTLKRFFRDKKLYITLNSSVVRSQLYFQKDALLEKINAILRADALFTAENREGNFVDELILK